MKVGRAVERKGGRTLALAVLLCTALPPYRLTAQCPDGSPPPCRGARTAAAPNANSVAVLYFDNLSRDTADAYLADGLTEELIVRLGQVRRLEVKSRFESLRVRGRTGGDPRVLGRSLRAAYLVTGTMQQAGQQVRLRVSLVRTTDGANVWGDVYDRTGGNVLQIQSDIAREVAGAITGQLLPAERASLTRRPTQDPIAYQLYVRAVGAANGTLSEAGLRSALALLNEAIARDSLFADAWAEKAFVWSWLADGYVTGRIGFTETRAAAERALRLDSTQSLAWALLSLSVMALDRDGPRAEALARRALSLDPRQPHAYTALSNALAWAGRMTEYVEANRRAFESDTLSGMAASLYLFALNGTADHDVFARVLPRAQPAADPAEYRSFEGMLRLNRGDPAGALERLDWKVYGGEFAAARARALMALRRPEAARAMVDSMVRVADGSYMNPYGIAATWAEIGDADQAFAWLDRANEQRTIWFIFVGQDRAFTTMHGDPRWAALMRSIGHHDGR